MDSGRQQRFAQRFPFYYGWVVFASAALTSYHCRPLMAATTLSVFVVPMTEELGWSRGLFSGALSLGGFAAVAVSPFVGRLIYKYGAGWVVASASGAMGLCAIGLSLITQAWIFYALYIPGRMLFASPLELGTATAVSNWFQRRRPLAFAILGATQGSGLAAMPLVAQLIISGWDWQMAWLSLGIFTISIGIIPSLLMARRPEDMGLELDPEPRQAQLTAQPNDVGGSQDNPGAATTGAATTGSPDRFTELSFTVQEALHTRAFWILAAFSAFAFAAQGGVAVHQVPHYINEGMRAPIAAIMASTFAISQVAGGFIWSGSARKLPLRFLLAMTGLCVGVGAIGTGASGTLGWGIAAAAAFGVGMGGMHLLLRLAWADYYGREHLGAIRGLTLPIQISGQAIGPIVSGFMFDSSGSYHLPFFIFGAGVVIAAVGVLAATPPQKQQG